MKTRHTPLAIISLFSALVLSTFTSHSAGVPDYRGKVVLIVDQTIAANLEVSNKLVRLVDDLAGDGWRVLRHDVERGGTPGTTAWAAQVREVRALLKANYDAAPSEVKSVFLIGHLAVPYSGNTIGIVGGHTEWQGAHPADAFYGEMTSPYGSGWDDIVQNISGTPFPNAPGDGRFDQNLLPSSMELAVGRVDFSNMNAFFGAGVDEAKLISRYLDKDHDFRIGDLKKEGNAVCLVQQRVLKVGYSGWPGVCNEEDFGPIVPNPSLICDANMHWFPNVKADGQDYLFGYGQGAGWTVLAGHVAACIGTTSPNYSDPHPSIQSAQNNFVDFDSRVVFVNLYGSYFGTWDIQDSFLRAPLANPYDPANGRYGYGLTTVWSDFGLDQTTLSLRALGAPIGDAMFTGFPGSVHFGLMGDPTLRVHPVRSPTALTAAKTATTVTLNWTASPDATGNKIYRAPTKRGPYTLIATVGNVSTYVASRPVSTDPDYPDNCYMVRATKNETTPSGSYGNMSVGGIVKLTGGIPSYYKIQSGPAKQVAAVGDSVAFAVDALGITAVGTEKIYYQWYKNGVAIPANDTSIVGGTTHAIIIKNVQSTDAGTYTVYVSLTPGISPKTASATLAVTAVDSYTIVRDTTTDFQVLSNDKDSTGGNSALTIASVSALSDPSAGTVTISPDNRSIHFDPSRTWLGPVSLSYIAADGTALGQTATAVTINVNPHSPNQPPTVSSIANQAMNAYSTIQVPFTVSDPDYTLPDDLVISVSCSNPTLLYQHNLTITGSGQNRVLTIKAGAQTGSGTVTVTVKDEDLGVTTRPFTVTVNPLQVPTLFASGFSGNDFGFTVHGPANSSVGIKRSDDLITWTSLGQALIGVNNSYCFTDNSVGSIAQRFYSAKNLNGISANAIGFVKRTIPAGLDVDPSCGGACDPTVALITYPLHNPAGNNLEGQFPDGPELLLIAKWNPTYPPTAPFDDVLYFTGFGWLGPDGTPLNLSLNPGESAWFYNFNGFDVPLTFVGDVPQGQLAYVGTPSSQQNIFFTGSMVPKQGNLDALGFPAIAGDQIYRWDTIQRQAVSPWPVFSGPPNNSWNPAVPNVTIGEGFVVYGGNSSPRTWSQSLSICPPDVTLTSPSQGSFFAAPANIALSASANANAGHDTGHTISSVKFYNGSTLIGQGTFSGGFYNFTWNNPPVGTHTITAQATDNSVYTGVPAGFTTISAPVTVTVLSAAAPTLSGGSLSGNNFTFTIKGTSGAQVNVYATTDFATWTSLGSVTLSGGVGTAVDSSASSFGYRFYSVKHGSVCSANSLGFIKVTVPGKVGGAGGEAWIANQLDNPAGNTLTALLPGVPAGTVVTKYDTVTVNYETATFSGTSWCPANMTLNPGEGARIYNPTTSPFTVTFVGSVPVGQLNVALPPGFALISSVFPQSASLITLGVPSVEEDQVLRFITGSQQTAGSVFDGAQWLDYVTGNPVTVAPAIGEAFFYFNSTSAGRTWTRNITVCPP